MEFNMSGQFDIAGKLAAAHSMYDNMVSINSYANWVSLIPVIEKNYQWLSTAKDVPNVLAPGISSLCAKLDQLYQKWHSISVSNSVLSGVSKAASNSSSVGCDDIGPVQDQLKQLITVLTAANAYEDSTQSVNQLISALDYSSHTLEGYHPEQFRSNGSDLRGYWQEVTNETPNFDTASKTLANMKIYMTSLTQGSD
jgi:hypothetical protein